MNTKYKPGDKLYMLTFVKPVKRKEASRHWVWLFKCDCGTMKQALLHNVVSGATKSCGCIRWKNHSEKISIYVEQVESEGLDDNTTSLPE